MSKVMNMSQTSTVKVCCQARKSTPIKAQQPVEKFINRIKEAGPKVAQFGAGLCASALIAAGGANALSYDDFQGLTYLQVKGTGLANTCPVIEGGTSDVKQIRPGSYNLTNFCLEPTSFTVKEEGPKGGEPEFTKTKLVTRLTYTLTDINARFTVGAGGEVALQEEDGIDFAPVTVQLPGGERVAFLFTIKQLDAKGSLEGFQGSFNVPSYRGSSFLDPRGRGGSQGYESYPGLPVATDAEEYAKENLKTYKTYKGQAILSVAKYDSGTGEVAGVFESIQPSDTDQGSKIPKDVKIQGLWYGRLN